MIIAENTTHFVGASEMFNYGKSLKSRWAELMDFTEPSADEQEQLDNDPRSIEEFAGDIWKSMRKKKKKKK